MSQTSSPSVRVLSGIHEIAEADWNRLLSLDPADECDPGGDPPFCDHRFLLALEQSGCATAERGFLPCHFLLYRGDEVLAAAPAYIKGDSDGDFSRDWDWAAGAERAGLPYYPKLVFALPFTPVTGRRFLFRPGLSAAERESGYAMLLAAARHFCKERGIASLHVLFPTAAQVAQLGRHGLSPRVAFQYHFQNPGYRHPDEFYARFSSKRRNALKRERAAPQSQGITLRTLRGDEIAADPGRYADLAHALHSSTVEKLVWGRRWLNQGFYRRFFAAYPQAVQLVLAERQGHVIAGAFNAAAGFSSASTAAGSGVSAAAPLRRIWGRYWGCFEEHPFLHFNVCYYHSIDTCITDRVRVFEGGAGGEHKIARGFEPSETYSAHQFFHPRLDVALRRHLEQEHQARSQAIAAYREQAPVLKPWQPGEDGDADT
jgi:predicted N-acyltransferase